MYWEFIHQQSVSPSAILFASNSSSRDPATSTYPQVQSKLCSKQFGVDLAEGI